MKYQFKNGDGVICENPSEANKLLVLALNNGYRVWSFTDTCNCFSVQTGIFYLCQESDIKRQISPSDFTALIQGKLPQCLCFDIREKDSDKALAYLNGKYKTMSGMFYTYYVFDGTKNAMALDKLEQFENSPFLLPVQYILDAAEEEKRILDDNVKLFDAARPKYMDELIKRFSHVFTEKENAKQWASSPFNFLRPFSPELAEAIKKHFDRINKHNFKPMATQKITRENLRVIWDLLSADMQVILTKRMTDQWDKNEIEVSDDEARSILLRYDSESKNYKELSHYIIVTNPGYVPFDFSDADIIRGSWVKYKKDRYIAHQIKSVSSIGITVDMSHIPYCPAFEQLEFLDGKPFGKLKP